MIFILANDAHLARSWAENEDIPDSDWCFATAEELRTFPSGEHDEHRLIMLEGAEMSPNYAMILDIARDRGIQTSTAPIHPGGHGA